MSKLRRSWVTLALVVVAAVVSVAPAAAQPAVAPTPSLQFIVQPSQTVINQPILGGDFSSGQPLAVEIVNGDGNVITSSSAPVTISLATNPGGGTLSGTTTVNAVNGVATFSDLSINNAGNGYALLATSPGANPATSRPFNEVDSGTRCSGSGTCTTNASTTTSSLAVTTPSGTTTTLSVSFNIGSPLVCTGYTPMDSSWFSFLSSSTTSGKIVTYVVRPSTDQKEIVGATQFCLGAPYQFETASGTPAAAGTLPDGSSGYTGLLPRCKTGMPGPCVASKGTTPDASSPTGFDIVVNVSFPAGLPGDPWGRM